MEESIVDLTRRAFELWNAREFERLLELFEEDGVWDMRPVGVPGMEEYRGHDAIRRFFSQWLEAFPDSRIAVEEVESRGEWGLATVLQEVSGGSSGAPVPFRYFGIGHWQDGRLRWVENYMDGDRAQATFERYSTAAQPSLSDQS